MVGNNLKRLEYVDAAKGLGILLMVLGHIWINACAEIVIWIYSFHMPMFFLLSGIILRYTKIMDKKSLAEIIRKKFRQLIVPYIVFEFIYVILIGSLHQFDYEILQWRWYDGLFFLPVNGPLWFLLCLFLIECVFVCLHTFVKNNKFLLFFTIILYLVPFILISENPQIKFLMICCTAYGFLSLGYYLFDYIRDKQLSWFKITFLLFIGAILALVNTKTNMYELNYKNPFLYSINGVITSFTFIFIFKRVKIKFLIFWGKNTILMLSLHILCISIISKIKSYCNL